MDVWMPYELHKILSRAVVSAFLIYTKLSEQCKLSIQDFNHILLAVVLKQFVQKTICKLLKSRLGCYNKAG